MRASSWFCVLALAAGCQPVVTNRLEHWRVRFPGILDAPQVQGAQPVAVELPHRAGEPARITDVETGLGASFLLEGTVDVAASHADAAVFFAGVGPAGADMLLRPVPGGVEDFVILPTAPQHSVLRYRVYLQRVAGLRLVENTLELLDGDGIPRLRVPPPYTVDARGTRRDAVLAVEGCAVDHSPNSPFHRAVTAPGANVCTLGVSWDAQGLVYPVVVDPVWMSTANAMATARVDATATLLSPTAVDSLVLIAGGSSTVGGAVLRSAELYEPLSRRFSVTGSMNIGRTLHTATALHTVSSPPPATAVVPVLVAGGADSANSPLGSLEVYDPATGQFTQDANAMNAAPRFSHAATLMGDGVVLLTGGTTLPLNQPTNTSYVYFFTSVGGGAVLSMLSQNSSFMASSRTGHAAVRLDNGQVLLTGGFVLAGGALQALQSAELFDPGTSTFGPVVPQGGAVAVMSSQRGFHSMTPLGGGLVLVAGGLTRTVGGIYINTVDIFSDGTNGESGFLTQPVPLTMATGRSNHTATLLPGGRVVVVGGFTAGGSATTQVEVFDPSTRTFSSTTALPEARGGHAAALVNAGGFTLAGRGVLVLGGAAASSFGSGAWGSAVVLRNNNGESCVDNQDCASGYCAGTTQRVCCDTRCDGVCQACTAALKGSGVDGECGAAAAGTQLGWSCVSTTESLLVCGPGGTVVPQESNVCPGGCAAERCAPYDAGPPDAGAEPPDAAMEDAAVATDAAVMDAATPDAAAVDGGTTDASVPDAATALDAAVTMDAATGVDAAVRPDAAVAVDAAMPDAARADAAVSSDGGRDAGTPAPDAATGGDDPGDTSSCGCSQSLQDGAPLGWMVLALWIARRARRTR